MEEEEEKEGRTSIERASGRGKRDEERGLERDNATKEVRWSVEG